MQPTDGSCAPHRTHPTLCPHLHCRPTQPADGGYTPHQTARHPNPSIHTIVAVMSTGPVGIMDRVNATDVAMVKRTCMADGRLLQPSRAIAATDASFALDWKRRQGSGQSAGQSHVWRTMSSIPDGAMANAWHYVLGFKLSGPYELHVDDLAPPPSVLLPGHAGHAGGNGALALARPYAAQAYVYRRFDWPLCTDGGVPGAGCAAVWDPAGTLARGTSGAPVLGRWQKGNGTANNGTMYHELVTLAPVVAGFAVLGELGKYVAVSPARFQSVAHTSAGVVMQLAGAAQETIAVTVLVPADGVPAARSKVVEVTFTASGVQTVTVSA